MGTDEAGTRDTTAAGLLVAAREYGVAVLADATDADTETFARLCDERNAAAELRVRRLGPLEELCADLAEPGWRERRVNFR